MNTKRTSIIVLIVLFAAGALLFSRSKGMRSFAVESAPSSALSNDADQQVENTSMSTIVTADPIPNAPSEVTPEKDVVSIAVPVKDNPVDTTASVREKAKPSENAKTAAKAGASIKEELVAFGFSVPSKPRTIDTIILHSSYDAIGSDPYSVPGVIGIWKSYDVAPHYLIDRDGVVYRLVKDENIAYHAGVSQVPDGRKNVNDFSIGIEIINTLDGQYTDEQYAAVKNLIASLKGKYAIKYVLGHDDIAPGRKTDPWNFDWKKL